MNSYFQLFLDESGTGLKLYPPTADGKALDINEIIAYLQLKRIEDYDVKAIYAALQTLTEEVIVPLIPKSGYHEREMLQVSFSPDKMQAFVRFYPPSNGGQYMDKREIINDLNSRKVTFGIKQEVIDEFLTNRQYCTDIEVAVGEPPVHGNDASIEYFFNTDLRAKPARNEDGSVDFFNLNTISHCYAGQVLAKLTRATKGEPGHTVEGTPIKPRDVKNLNLSFGSNITLSEDHCSITSDLNGHVSLVEGKVFVSDVYETENVGTATGNITAAGSVLVTGNVQSGFSVKAEGNVEVRGVVEGAVIEAGGDIIIAKGMNGMGKGILKAGGRIVAHYIENATVTAGGFVESNSIMHSTVSAGNEITVDGKRGFIAGGIARATNRISCKVLGSKMGADTVVEVGIDPEVKAKYSILQKEILELDKSLKNIQPILLGATQKLKKGEKLNPEQMKYIQTLALANQQQTNRLADAKEELAQVEELLSERGNAEIRVKDEAFPGTRIVVSEASMTLRSSVSFCRFIYERGDVKMVTL